MGQGIMMSNILARDEPNYARYLNKGNLVRVILTYLSFQNLSDFA
jgi:hypothetical protein